ncbi:hypothetical protein KIW84_055009 [Lathyrus oleraceus]|uniref:Reverse transcriptase/retrotransposon-derived protein RNase H-like domain-containing protein n=1 Tax=Pisum sativum TaxID=3888 RepID=A0A9D4WZI0_PEA|nr:hypothetical protein KIW84_055009 [Pisum sativum]
MTATCEPILNLLCKDQAVEWNPNYQGAFEKIRNYMQETPILIPPIQGKSLFMYLIVLEEFMGCVLGQQDKIGQKEHMLLSEYGIQYVTQKAIKGSVLTDYLSHQPVKDYESLKFDFPDEDIMVIKDYEIPDPGEGPEPGS